MSREELVAYLTVALTTAFFMLTAPTLMNWYDVHYFEQWFRAATAHGILKVYSVCEKVHYPPLAVIYYVAVRDLVHVLRLDTDPWTFQFSMKVPLALCYLLTSLIIVRRFKWPVAQWGIVSIPMGLVIWGYQFDTIIAFLMALSAVSVLESRPVAAGALLALATSFKYVPAVMAVPMTLILRARGGSVQSTRFLAAFAGLTAALWLPFFLEDPEAFWRQVFLFHMLRLPQDLTPFYLPLVLSRWHVHPWFFLLGKVSGAIMAAGFAVIVWWMWNRRDGVIKTLIDRVGPKFALWGTCALLAAWFALTTKVGNPYYLAWVYLWVFPFAGWLIPAWRVGLMNSIPFLFTVNRLPAPVLNEKVFVVEDLRWYPALSLLGFSSPHVLEKAHQLRKAAPKLMWVWYNHMHLTEAALVACYTMVTAWNLIDILRWVRDPREPNERPDNRPIHPLLVAFTLPGFAFALYLAWP